tara:strand:+ start:105 stop:1943 length:1839 start_codon:yes stop_codon:yes gene_type:complete
MFYKKIDLRKLYENTEAESLLNDDMPAAAEEPMLPGDDKMPAGADDVSQEEEDMARKEAIDLKKQKNAGRMYAWPISQEIEDELRSLAASGSGVWTASEPLKLWVNGKDGEPAMIGEKPVYLRIKVVANRSDRHNPVQSEADREYVEYVTSSNELVNALDTAVNITNSVRVSVNTPFLKSGKNTEHSLEMWLDHESRSGEEVMKDTIDQNAEDMDLPPVGDIIDPTGDGKVNVDMELQMENPGTAAGIGEIGESNAYFYNEFEVERMIGSILENVEYQLIKKSSGNPRWLLDVTNDKAYSIASPEEYKALAKKLSISTSSVLVDDAKVDAAISKAGNAGASSFLKDVTPAEAVKPKSSTVTVSGAIADIIKTKRALKKGRKGEAVKELQQFLNIDDDGIFGKGTEAAVKKWQEENGLEVDGIIGSGSAAKIVELMSNDKDSSGEDAASTEEENTNTSGTENQEPDKEENQEPDKEEEEPETQDKEKDLEEMSLEELEAELESTKDELKDAKKNKRKNKKADRKKKRLINRINRKKKRANESVDQDGDGDNDFDDVKIARMIASGMSKAEATRKVKGSKKKPVNEATVFTFDDFIKRSNGLQDNLNDFFNGKK